MSDNSTSTIAELGQGLRKEIKKQHKLLFWSGLLMLVVGVVALLFPVVSTLTVAMFVGFMFIFAGVAGIMMAFTLTGTGPFFGAFLWGLLSMAAGVYLVAQPIAAAVILTITVAVLFLFQGAHEIYLAVQLRGESSWFWLLLSGVLSILLTFIILSSLPEASAVILGILMGVNFIASGLAYMFIASAVKKQP